MTALAQSKDVQPLDVLPLREDAERRGEVFVYEAPDLPGQWVARDAVTDVVSQGNSRPHALAMLAEALALHAGEALPTGEASGGARTVDAIAREVVAWAATPKGVLAMMTHRGKQDLVALATAVLERGALVAGLGASEALALGPEAIPPMGCDWKKIEGILSGATPLVVFEILTRLAQHLITRLHRPCPHEPPHLVGVVPPQLQGDAQAWLRLADPHVVKIQAILDQGRALLAQGGDLVAESDTLLAGGRALVGLPGEPS